MEENLCELCQVPAKQSCSSCHSAFYCSKECQKRAWKKHKGSCIPYVIQHHPVYGRYVVATRDIEAGEIVMREIPIAVGPQLVSKPMCLGCHSAVTGTYTCSKCNYPLCSSVCEKSVFHEGECQVFSRAKSVTRIESMKENHPAYECILPLRCLLMKYTDPKKWKILNTMQDSINLMTQDWRERIQTNIINYIKNFINFKGEDTMELFRICGILHTNSFEVKDNGQPIEGVFPKVALMAHDCSPNTENIFDSTMKATVRSTVFIPKGTSITATYTTLLWNTLKRRNHLLRTKFFECACQRCSDPTEIGTHLGTLLCSQCGGQVLSTAPLNNDAIWSCRDCNYSISSKDVARNYEFLYKSFLERDRSKIEPLEDLIELCNNKLHDSHQIPTDAKFAWIKFCGNHPNYRYKDISKATLQKKISYCRDLMKLGDAIFPGKSTFRGFVLYELHASLKAMANKLLSFGDLNNESIQEYMSEAEGSLQESKEIFCFEHEMKATGIDDKLTLLTEEFEALR